MPCMGPSKEFAEHVADEIFEEVLQLIKDDHHIDRPIAPVFVAGPDGHRNLSMNLQKKYDDEWGEAKENLRKALRELVWIYE